MKTTTGIEYELRSLSLAEREICNNAKAIIRGMTEVVIEDAFSKTLRWLRFGLKTLEGEELTDQNRDEKINTLSNEEINEISGEISERTNGGIKKKF
uniref:Uncharacterized protein n=1 Tax=viral metagenome TaxID=1070528 RepID=A0A6M3KE16_9ZZZZ